MTTQTQPEVLARFKEQDSGLTVEVLSTAMLRFVSPTGATWTHQLENLTGAQVVEMARSGYVDEWTEIDPKPLLRGNPDDLEDGDD